MVVEQTLNPEWDDALMFDLAIDPFRQIATAERESGKEAGKEAGYLEGMNIGRSKGWEIGLELGYIHNFAKGILDHYQQLHPEINASDPQSLSLHESEDSMTGGKCNNSEFNNFQPKTGSENRSNHRLERCLTLSRDIVKMINEVPDPDILLSQIDGKRGEELENADSATINSSCSETSCSDNYETCAPQSAVDVSGAGTSNISHGENNNEATASREAGVIGSTAMFDVSSSLQRIRAKFKLLCVLLRTRQKFELKKVLETQTIVGENNDLAEMYTRNEIDLASDKKTDKGEQNKSIIQTPDNHLFSESQAEKDSKSNNENAIESEW